MKKIDNTETCIKYKIDNKVARNEATESAGKSNSREKLPPQKSTIFHQIQRNFHGSENNNNEESKLIFKDTNVDNNNNEDNHLRINRSNIESGINESTVKSNQNKLVFILGDTIW